MASLRQRVEEVEDRDTKIPLVVADSMLPRQVLKLETTNPAFIKLIQSIFAEDNPSFGMVGAARIVGQPQDLPMQNGVLVRVVGKPQVLDDVKEPTLRVDLLGTERFRITGELETSPEGWTQGRVRFLETNDEAEHNEIMQSSPDHDQFSLARAIALSRNLTDVSEGGKNLVDQWIEFARATERAPGQIDQLLVDLGEIPPPDKPSDRAFWIGALVNPLPGMGVAMEIRPSLLMAATAEERVRIALQAIQASIRHMDGTEKLF